VLQRENNIENVYLSGPREALRNAIQETGVNDKIVKEVSVVPASYRELPLPDTTGADCMVFGFLECLSCAYEVRIFTSSSTDKERPTIGNCNHKY
jgi:hypothetical protein